MSKEEKGRKEYLADIENLSISRLREMARYASGYSAGYADAMKQMQKK